MIIRSHKQYSFVVFFLFAALFVLAIFMYSQTKNWQGALILFLVCSPIVTTYWIAVGRIFTLNQSGVTVSFLWYKKEIPWEQMKVKKFFHTECSSYGYREPYTEGVEFCYKKLRRPRWIKPFQYTVCAHPISYIVFNFPVNSPQNINYPPIYEVDKALLEQTLNEWNVDMQ